MDAGRSDTGTNRPYSNVRVLINAVRIDYFCSRLLVDYLSTSRLIVDYFSYNTRITFQRCIRKQESIYGLVLL